ncbi:MAG: hypothetical protein KDA63_13885, partial [Planctomycetales bacterium]|nr:hypothetical protein [Planctomycetales bacterium]
MTGPTTERMTDRQRAVLQRAADARHGRLTAELAHAVPVMLLNVLMGVVLGVFLGVIPEMSGVPFALPICLAVGTALGATAGLVRCLGQWRRRARALRRLDEDLAAGLVETQTFEVYEAVRLGGEARQGPSYFLAVSPPGDLPAQVLFLNDPFAELLSVAETPVGNAEPVDAKPAVTDFDNAEPDATKSGKAEADDLDADDLEADIVRWDALGRDRAHWGDAE